MYSLEGQREKDTARISDLEGALRKSRASGEGRKQQIANVEGKLTTMVADSNAALKTESALLDGKGQEDK